jgi:hypothetical protein
MVKFFFVLSAVSLTLASPQALLLAEDKPAEKKEPPKVIMAVPLAVSPGGKSKVTLRGVGLDRASEVSASVGEQAPAVELKKKEKAGPPNGFNASEVGDSFVDLELELPADFAGGELPLVVTSDDGASQPYVLLVVPPTRFVSEAEPNEGFRKPGKLAADQWIVGSIQQQRDVDVFQIEAQAGQSLTAEVMAARRGSALDSLLMLHDSAGQLLVQNDDQPEHRDSLVSFKVPSSGVYFLTLIDAHDRGSSAQPYLLHLRAE